MTSSDPIDPVKVATEIRSVYQSLMRVSQHIHGVQCSLGSWCPAGQDECFNAKMELQDSMMALVDLRGELLKDE